MTTEVAIGLELSGVKELINDSNGFKVKPRDNEDLASAMKKMIEEYASFDLQKISEEAVRKYEYSKVGREFSECYEKLRVES